MVEKECQLALLVDGNVDCVFQVLEAFNLDLVAVAPVNKERLFFALIFASGENLSFFLTAANIYDFKPFVGGV